MEHMTKEQKEKHRRYSALMNHDSDSHKLITNGSFHENYEDSRHHEIRDRHENNLRHVSRNNRHGMKVINVSESLDGIIILRGRQNNHDQVKCIK